MATAKDLVPSALLPTVEPDPDEVGGDQPQKQHPQKQHPQRLGRCLPEHPPYPVRCYSPSGFDLMKVMYYVATRPHPTIDLGPVDASCPIVLCDLLLPDTPVAYVSDSFLALTGYAKDEVLGRNCRFLQRPPPPPPLSPASPASPASRNAADTQSTTALEPTPHVPPLVRKTLRQAVANNWEAQVCVTNFRRDGTPFANMLSLVPIAWDDDDNDGDGGGGGGGRSRQEGYYRYCVGFASDVSAKETGGCHQIDSATR